MKVKNLYLLVLFLPCFCLLVVPKASEAATVSQVPPATGLAGIEVNVKTLQGGEWFVAMTKRIDENGILEIRNALSGWSKIELDDEEDAALAGQTFTTRMKLLDHKGRRITEETSVDIFAKIGGIKTFLATMETDDEGWLTVPGGMLGVESFIDVEGDGDSLSNDHGKKPRINVDAKMDDGRWFRAFQSRLNGKGILTMKNARPGKSKFSYVSGDEIKISGSDLINRLNQKGKLSDKLAAKFQLSDFAGKIFEKPFTLRVQVLDDDGEKIKKPTKVKMTVYLKNRTLKGTLKTDNEGWLTIPGVPTDITTKMEVDD